MRLLALTLLALVALFGHSRHAEAAVEARINISSQRMIVMVDGVKAGEYAVSTGRKGYRTPVGEYQPQRMHKKYYSKKYHNSPMPNSIFFNGGIAVHGTYEVAASAGPPRTAASACIRRPPPSCSIWSSSTAWATAASS